MTRAVEPAATPKVGLVLAGGAARGAYEVGVLEHLVEDVSRDLGYDVPLDVLCGTSVGAINCCCMAAWADEPRARVARLVSVWGGLRMDEIIRPTSGGVFDVVRGLLGRARHIEQSGSLFDPAPMERLLRALIPFERIDKQLRAGRLTAVSVSTTQVASGRTVVFVQRRQAQLEPWTATPNVVARTVRLRPVHALASAAVPVMFPAVRIDGRYYCDGGLRQNIPLSPARRLGATHLVVVNPKHHRAKKGVSIAPTHDEGFPSPLFLVGKALNALLIDRIDNEIDRFDKINAIIDAGTELYGDSFTQQLNEAMGENGGGLKRLQSVHIRASENLGALSAEYVRSPSFRATGFLGRLMKRLAEGEAAREADLLSYLLFDGQFASQLMDLGRADARQHHDELCQLFESMRLLRESA